MPTFRKNHSRPGPDLAWVLNDTAMWINVDAFHAASVPIPSQDPTAALKTVDASRFAIVPYPRDKKPTINLGGEQLYIFNVHAQSRADYIDLGKRCRSGTGA